MSQSSEVLVNIRNIAVGGEGVGEVCEVNLGDESLLGITAFVPYSAPGERLKVRVSERHTRYVRGELLEAVAQSVDRVTPECRYFGTCGGCDLQHLAYEAQLNAKFEMVSGALRAARLKGEVIEKLRPVAAGPAFKYRRRIALHVGPNGKLGFYRSGSRSVVEVDSCSVAVPEIEAVLPRLKEFAREVYRKVTSVVLEADERGVVAVLKTPYDLTTNEVDQVLGKAKKILENVTLLGTESELGGFGRQILDLPLNDSKTVVLRVPASAFSQVNWEINRKLISDVVRNAEPKNGTTIEDLYAGAGNFSLPLARDGASVTAVECEPRLVLFGRQNAERYGLSRLSYVESSVEKYLSQARRNAEVIVADPPRSGLGAIVPQLSYGRKLVLVSCHLPSFVRDLKGLVESGWNVDLIQPYDMFAQTSYLEIMSVYSR